MIEVSKHGAQEMLNQYPDVTTRFLRDDERLILSAEKEMPLVIEANQATDLNFLKNFIATHSDKLIQDMAKYGAILLRGFNVSSDEDFEKTILSIQGIKGISEAFMSEQGRIPVNHLKYVLHTNAVYKTGGTLYLGGFHSENYYTPDVPSYIFFCCHKPSQVGGETGLINMEKVYNELDDDLKEKLENKSFFVCKWLLSEVATRYQTSNEEIEKICHQFALPVVGSGNNKFILMYKPSVFEHPITMKKALGINLFALPTLNDKMRKHFINDYQGKTWFWHRIVWRLPTFVVKILESIYIMCASLFYSPKESFKILKSKWNTYKKSKNKNQEITFNNITVNDCFTDKNVEDLARLLRQYYCSCLWKSGDILLVDNKKIAHAGMPGAGPRLIRAMISNPINMKYNVTETGNLHCRERTTETIGYHVKRDN